MIELLQDVLHSLKQGRSRAISAGFGVAWGIIILILLLGIGGGVKDGILRVFSNYSSKAIVIECGTSIDENTVGSIKKRDVFFSKSLVDNLKELYSNEIKTISPELYSQFYVKSKRYYSSFTVKGVSHEYFDIANFIVQDGRTFNTTDNSNMSRFALIGSTAKDILFSKKNPIGEYIEIEGVLYKIVGIIQGVSPLDIIDDRSIFIPLSSYEEFLSKTKFKRMSILLYDNVNANDFTKSLQSYLANTLNFKENDKSALLITNYEEQFKSLQQVFNGFQFFLWLIGICFILSGMIGISNIMHVIVKEQTKNFGIRKSIGASPSSIVSFVILESMIITFTAGCLGLFIGIFIINIINLMLRTLNVESLITHIPLNYIVISLSFILVIIAGAIAGVYPAMKAARIRPLHAIRQE